MLIVTGQNSILKYSIAYQSDGLWNDLYQGSVDPKTQPQSFMGYGFIQKLSSYLKQKRWEESFFSAGFAYTECRERSTGCFF